jgi:hypothetical protein
MKKLLTLAFVCLVCATSFGQNVPQGIAYQAVAVKDGAHSVAGQNPQAIYWSNKDIKVRFTIFEKYPNGSSQYSEFHETTTDDYGVFNLIIGQGNSLFGNFETIPWELGAAHLQVEIDFENTNTYTLTSLEKFWSVPYALVTNETGTSSTDSALSALNSKYDYLKNRDKDTVIGNEGISYQTLDSLNKALKAEIAALRAGDKDTVVGNELQTLSVIGDSVSISDGNTVVINHPANLDNDPTNEIQNISLSNDTIHLSKGGGKIALEEINNYVKINGGGSGSSSSSSIYKPNTNISGGTFLSSTPYGNFFSDTAILDTLNLTEGDRVVLYVINSSGASGFQRFRITDSTNKQMQCFVINHSSAVDGSAPTGQSNAAWTNAGGKDLSSVTEMHLPVTYSGTYYIQVYTGWYQNTSLGTTPIGGRGVGWRYYEIN